jgi:hypothetical protein
MTEGRTFRATSRRGPLAGAGGRAALYALPGCSPGGRGTSETIRFWNMLVRRVQADMAVTDPLTGAQGGKGALYFPNNIMMYRNTPSQKGSEAFLSSSYYYRNMTPLSPPIPASRPAKCRPTTSSPR